MNLISCDECGVVIDSNKVVFPENLYTDEGCIDDTKAIWKNREFVPYISCPVCKEPITKD